MTPEQYMMKRAEIVSEYMEEIDEHESAGEFGDAENALKQTSDDYYRGLEDGYRIAKNGGKKLDK